MKIVYGLLTLFMLCAVGYCAYRSSKMSGRMAKAVCACETVSFLCGLAFVGYTFIPDITVATLCRGLMLALFDWVLYILMYYTQLYTGLFKGVMGVKLVMVLYSAFDTITLIANTWCHNIFTVEKIQGDVIKCSYIESSWLYKAHFLYTYIVMIMLLTAFAFEIVKTSKFYRIRYVVIFVALLMAFLFDLFTIGSESIYDTSMIVFAVMVIMIYYFTLSYVPNELIENTLSLVVKDMNSGIVCFDNRGKCAYCNDIIKDMYKTDDIARFELRYKNWLTERADDRRDAMKLENNFTDADGVARIYEIVYKRIYDEKENIICDYFMINDRTEEIQSLKREKYRASHDSLTQLLNSSYFYGEVSDIIHSNPGSRYYLICSNVKDFKFVNELFGINKGDEILKKEAALIKDALPKGSVCARLHDDRFALLIQKDMFNEDTWRNITKELQYEFDNNAFRLHVFAGVYEIDDLDEPVSIMCDKANLASELVKDDYQNCVSYYNKDLLEKTIEEGRVIAEFERALKNEEFVMFLQPQVDGTGKAHGAEALVRWQHPERGLLSPFFFIDILEKAGLIYKLDKYMWEKAAKQLSIWKNTDKSDYHISVNISTKDFYLLDVYETFVEMIARYGIEPEKLKLEITETALMSDFKKNMEIIRKLQNYGFKIEIDDFGSGYSSLNMLKDISADILKIDMGFLRASENEVKGRDILETIIVLAKKLGMEVITEGVETKEQLDMLSAMGCNMYQGYYFSKPIQVDEFENKFM